MCARDNPRSFFRFEPLVPAPRDEYQALLAGAKKLAKDGEVIRGVDVTEELYDLILFTVHALVRPATTALYALKHNDVTVDDKGRGEGEVVDHQRTTPTIGSVWVGQTIRARSVYAYKQ